MNKVILVLAMTVLSGQAFGLDCAGTEPFWSAKISADKVELKGSSDQTLSLTPITRTSGAAGYSANFLQVYSNERGPVAVVTSNSCNDGMSDYTYPQEVIIFTGEGTLYGCCGKGKL